MPGNTRTGGVLEAMILPALDRGAYGHRAQVAIGDRLGCGRHVVDAIAEKDGRQIWKRKLAYEYDWTIYSTVLLGVLFTTLEDLAHDIAEQTQMHGRLNEMIRGTN